MATYYKRTYKKVSIDPATGKRTTKTYHAKKYTIEWKDAEGRTRRLQAYESEAATKQKVAEIERQLEFGEVNLVDPFAEHKKRPLADHLADWLATLETERKDPMYIYNARKRLGKMFTACGWTRLSDINPNGFTTWRNRTANPAEGKAPGPVTLNQYLQTARTFLNWCVSTKRCKVNPLSDVALIEESDDIRRERRAFSDDEIAALLLAVPAYRRWVYEVAVMTGARRQELADLRWQDVRLDDLQPHIQFRAAKTKARRADTIPLHPELAQRFRDLRAERTPGEADGIFDRVPDDETFKKDLRVAREMWIKTPQDPAEQAERAKSMFLAYVDDCGRKATFHSLRHTFCTNVAKRVREPRVAMEIMRHASLEMTMKYYTDPRLFNTAAAVAMLSMPGTIASDTPAVLGKVGA